MKDYDQLKADTLTLFLANACNQHLSIEERAKRIKKCAKIISQRCTDKPFKIALKAIRNNSNALNIVNAITKAENNYHVQLSQQS